MANPFLPAQVRPREKSGYVDYNYERNFYGANIYTYESKENSSLSLDRVHALIFTRIERKERLLLNLLNCIFLWFNFYFVDFLELFARIASFLLIFRPKNIKKYFFIVKHKIDWFFTRRAHVSPIVSSDTRVN